MPFCETKYFGRLEYAQTSSLDFPRGLPGFEEQHRFVVVEHPSTKPLVYLQSLDDRSLCFVAVPVTMVKPDYELDLSDDDWAAIREHAQATPNSRDDLLCVAIVSIDESGATANLMAPIVADLRSRKAVQAIGTASGYSHRAPLGA